MPNQGTTYEDLREGEGLGIGEKITEAAGDVKDRVSTFGRAAVEKIDDSRDSAASGLDRAASSLHGVAGNLPGGEPVSHAAHVTADTLTSTAEYVRGNDLRKMMTDIEVLVKNNPGPSLLAMGVLGFVIGRAFSRND